MLFAAGHKLALGKGSYYLVDFKRHDTHFKYKHNRELDGVLKLNETSHNNPVTVPRLEPNSAHKTLGHLLAIDGNCKAHFDSMMTKLRRWSNIIKGSALCGYDRVAAYHGYLEKTFNT